MLKLLNVGCGPTRLKNTEQYKDYEEVRLDIDCNVFPDVVGTIQNIPLDLYGKFDVVVCDHNLEHVAHHEVLQSLKNLKSCLKINGVLRLKVPDLETVMMAGLNLGLDSVLYMSSMGPITPRDVIYGHERSLKEGNYYMAHKTGFTSKTLTLAAVEAGFTKPLVWRYPMQYELFMEAKNGI